MPNVLLLYPILAICAAVAAYLVKGQFSWWVLAAFFATSSILVVLRIIFTFAYNRWVERSIREENKNAKASPPPAEL